MNSQDVIFNKTALRSTINERPSFIENDTNQIHDNLRRQSSMQRSHGTKRLSMTSQDESSSQSKEMEGAPCAFKLPIDFNFTVDNLKCLNVAATLYQGK